jgi:RimJ/RimL family protein N-acetyltransferase
MATLDPQSQSSKHRDPIIIRSATIVDAQALLDFAQQVMNEPDVTLTEWDELDASLESERQFVERAVTGPVNLLLLAKARDQLVGMLNFSTHTKRKLSHAGEFGMSVIASSRDQGIGRLLLNALIEWISHQPTLECLELSVFAGNARAIHLYRSVGFEAEGRLRNAVKLADGRYDDLITMCRRSRIATTASGVSWN